MSQRQVFKHRQYQWILLILLALKMESRQACAILWLSYDLDFPLKFNQKSTWDLGMNQDMEVARFSLHLGRFYDEDGIRCGMKEFWVNVRLSPARGEMTSPEECLAQETRAAASLPITFMKNSPALREQGNGLPTKTHELDNSCNIKCVWTRWF